MTDPNKLLEEVNTFLEDPPTGSPAPTPPSSGNELLKEVDSFLQNNKDQESHEKELDKQREGVDWGTIGKSLQEGFWNAVDATQYHVTNLIGELESFTGGGLGKNIRNIQAQEVSKDIIKKIPEFKEYEQDSWERLAGNAVVSFVPTAAGVGLSAAGAPQVGAPLAQVGFAGLTLSSAGSALKEYDEYMRSKGQNPLENPAARWGISTGVGAVEYITERTGALNPLLKRFAKEGTKPVLKASPELISNFGQRVLADFAKKNPKKWASYATSIGSAAGSEGVSEAMAEIGQTAIQNWYKDNKDRTDFSTIMENALQAGAIGGILGASVGPLSFQAQQNQTRNRRDNQGFVRLGTIDGDPVEIIQRTPSKEGGSASLTVMFPDGRIEEGVSESDIKDTVDVSTDQFYNVLKGKQDEATAIEQTRIDQEKEQINQINQEIEDFYGPFSFQDGQGNRYVAEGKYDGMPVFIVGVNEKNKSMVHIVDQRSGGKPRAVDAARVTDQQTIPLEAIRQGMLGDLVNTPNEVGTVPMVGEEIETDIGPGKIISYDPRTGEASVEFGDPSTKGSDKSNYVVEQFTRNQIEQFRKQDPVKQPETVKEEATQVDTGYDEEGNPLPQIKQPQSQEVSEFEIEDGTVQAVKTDKGFELNKSNLTSKQAQAIADQINESYPNAEAVIEDRTAPGVNSKADFRVIVNNRTDDSIQRTSSDSAQQDTGRAKGVPGKSGDQLARTKRGPSRNEDDGVQLQSNQDAGDGRSSTRADRQSGSKVPVSKPEQDTTTGAESDTSQGSGDRSTDRPTSSKQESQPPQPGAVNRTEPEVAQVKPEQKEIIDQSKPKQNEQSGKNEGRESDRGRTDGDSGLGSTRGLAEKPAGGEDRPGGVPGPDEQTGKPGSTKGRDTKPIPGGKKSPAASGQESKAGGKSEESVSPEPGKSQPADDVESKDLKRGTKQEDAGPGKPGVEPSGRPGEGKPAKGVSERSVSEAKSRRELRNRVFNSESTSIRQDIMKYFAGGGRINTESLRSETGFGAMRAKDGSIRNRTEFNKRIWAISNKAPKMDDLAMSFAESWETNTGNELDTADIRNEIIDVLTSYDSKAAMFNDLVDDFSVDGKVVVDQNVRAELKSQQEYLDRFSIELEENLTDEMREFLQNNPSISEEIESISELTDQEAQKLLEDEEEFNKWLYLHHDTTSKTRDQTDQEEDEGSQETRFQQVIQDAVKQSIPQIPHLKGTDETNFASRYLRPFVAENKQRIEKIVNDHLKGWKNPPEVKVWESVLDISMAYPEVVRKANTVPGGIYQVTAFFYDGKLNFIASHQQFQNEDGVLNTLLHESVGHYGLRELFNRAGEFNEFEFNSLLDEVTKSYEKNQFYENISMRYFGVPPKELNETQKREVSEEFIAHVAETGTDQTLIDKMVAWFRKMWEKATGRPLPFSDVDLKSIIAASRQFLQTGEALVPRHPVIAYQRGLDARYQMAPRVSSFKKGDNLYVYARINGDVVASAMFAPDGEAMAVDVDPEYRRQGIATSMYKHAKDNGIDIQPGQVQTADAEAFWEGARFQIAPPFDVSNFIVERTPFHDSHKWGVKMHENGTWISTARTKAEAIEGAKDVYENHIRKGNQERFDKWFKGSKVVNPDGSPMVVYHGTTEDFNEFEGYDNFNYFAENKDYADKYGDRLMPVYLSITNPLDLTEHGLKDMPFGEFISILEGRGVKLSNDQKEAIAATPEGKIWEQMRFNGFAFRKSIEDAGYDGVKQVENIDKENKSNVWVAFSPTQIKSATANRGTFDPNNPDIRFQLIGEIGASNLDLKQEVNYRMDNLRKANALEEAGKSGNAIWLATGWERGKDGKWRYEIGDVDVRSPEQLVEYLLDGRERKLNFMEVLKFDELTKAYPDAKKIKLRIENDKEYTYQAGYEPGENTIVINSAHFLERFKDSSVGEVLNETSGLRGLRRVIAHELAHFVQTQEEFSKGGNDYLAEQVLFAGQTYVDALILRRETERLMEKGIKPIQAFDQAQKEIEEYLGESFSKAAITIAEGQSVQEIEEKAKEFPSYKSISEKAHHIYQKFAGETEARNVSRRMEMSEYGRENIPPSETESISREDQVIFEKVREIIEKDFDVRFQKSEPLESTAFGEWFRGSVVTRDGKPGGEPKVVYHGTGGNFDQFKPTFRIPGQGGFFFIDNPSEASKFAGTQRQTNQPSVYPVYLSLQNPLEVDFEGQMYQNEKVQKLFEEAKENGNDGIIIKNIKDRTVNATQYVAFEPTQIKSAVGNRGTFDPSNPDIRFQKSDPADNFYSNSLKAVSNIAQGKATGEQWKAMLLKNGASEAELKWIGFDQFLAATKKPTKQEVMDFIASNQIEVQEVVRGGESELEWNEYTPDDYDGDKTMWLPEDDSPYSIVEEDGEFVVYDNGIELSRERTLNDAKNYVAPSGTRYSQYQLPGGTNYKEVLLTLPDKRINNAALKTRMDNIEEELTYPDNDLTDEEKRTLRLEYKEIADKLRESDTYQSSHWDEPNILSHIRFNEREVNGERVLFVEEIQSDWAQEGRRKGFQSDMKAVRERIAEIEKRREELRKTTVEISNILDFVTEMTQKYGDFKPYLLSEAEIAQYETLKSKKEEAKSSPEFIAKQKEDKALSDELRYLNRISYSIPDMPFKSTSQWLNLSLRRMIRWGSENGFDRVAWINGQQSADRYDLSKQVDWVKYNPETKRLMAGKGKYGTDSYNRMIDNEVEPNELDGTVGKEVAQKLLDTPADSSGYKTVEGQDLKVGGTGMISFYDKIVPTQAKKVLGKIDKTANVETVDFGNFEEWFKNNRAKSDPTWDEYQNLPESEQKEFQKAYEEDQLANKRPSQQLSFPITPLIRQTALQEGMPLFQRVDTVQESPETFIKKRDKLIATWQDRMIYLKRLQDFKYSDKQISDELNAYDKENLSKGIILEQMRVFKKNLWTPMETTLKSMKKDGVMYEQASRYLKAKHIVEDKIERGGIPLEEAQQIVNEFESKTKLSGQLVDQVKKINQFIIDKQVESGLISKTRHDELGKMYKFYVPLRGFSEADFDPTLFTRDYQRKGRTSESGDPIGYLGAMAQTAIQKGEQNKVLKSLYNFIVENPDSKVYKIRTAYYLRDKETGRLLDVTHERPSKEDFEKYDVSMTDPGITDENEYSKYLQKTAFERENVTVKLDGRTVTMEFIGPDGKRIADAIKGTSMEKFPKVLGVIGQYTRLLRQAYTQYSPEFALRNWVRDTFTGLINVRTDWGTKRGLEMAGSIPGALKTVKDWVFSGEYNNYSPNGRYLREFVESGGLTGYSELKTVEDIKKELQASVDGLKKTSTALRKAKQVGAVPFNWLDNVNRMFETTTRFAAFRTMRENGMTPQQAAIYAKDLTVNFNRKGNISDFIGNFYLFFNASMQGVERLARPFVSGTKSQRRRAATQALFVLPALHTAMMLLNKMWWDKDEDGEYYYDKLPEYIRTHNLTIPNFFGPKGTFLHLPLPYGFNVFFTWPESVMAVVENRETAGAAMLKTFAMSAESFSPLGSPNFNDLSPAEAFGQYIAPTAGKPIVDVMINKNFMGNPIYKEPYPGQTPEPNSQRYFQSVNPLIRNFTDTLNEYTGGDTVVPGVVDVNPEVLEHFVSSWTGGLGKFITNVVGTTGTVFEGKSPLSYEDETIRKMPFVRNYTSSISPYYDQAKFYELAEEVKAKRDTFNKYKKYDREKAKNYRENNKDYLALYSVTQNYRERIGELKKRQHALEALGREEEAKVLEEKQEELFKKYILLHQKKTKKEETIDWRDLLGF